VIGAFMDDCLLPAVHSILPSHIAQEWPASFSVAKMKAFSAGIEGKIHHSIPERTWKMDLHYPLPAKYLVRIWEKTMNLLQVKLQEQCTANPRHYIQKWIGCQLLLNVKNTKTMFYAKTFLDLCRKLMKDFLPYLNGVFLNPDETWIDIGLVTSPIPEANHGHDNINHTSSYTCLPQWCCLKAFIQALTLGRGATMKVLMRSWALTQDAATLTLEPGKCNILWKGGLAYVQFYGSGKLMFDAGKHYPFEDDLTTLLAVDAELREGLRAAVGAQRVPEESLVRSYKHNLYRALKTLKDSEKIWYGGREEYRITLSLFLRIYIELK